MRIVLTVLPPLVALAACASPAEQAVPLRTLNPDLPTVGVLVYDKVLGTEVSAPFDVFAKHTEDGRPLFNVIAIAETRRPVDTEEGLRILPDRTFDNAPDLDVMIVPSAYDMYTLVRHEPVVAFIREQDKHTDFTVSNCGGAGLIGAAGIAKGRKIVTWVGGGEELQESYPDLLVQDDATVTFVRDGKFFSSNGNLATYVSSLELLEEMTSPEHRAYVESYLYLERLQEWPDVERGAAEEGPAESPEGP